MKPRLSFLLAVACASLNDRLQGRALAINDDDAASPRSNPRAAPKASTPTPRVVRSATPSWSSAATTGTSRCPPPPTDIPRGILLNDTWTPASRARCARQVAIFGLYPDTLPGVAAGAIAVNAELVADLATPGSVKALPTASGTYVVFGRVALRRGERGRSRVDHPLRAARRRRVLTQHPTNITDKALTSHETRHSSSVADDRARGQHPRLDGRARARVVHHPPRRRRLRARPRAGVQRLAVRGQRAGRVPVQLRRALPGHQHRAVARRHPAVHRARRARATTSQFVEYALYNFSDGLLALDNLADDLRGHRRGLPHAAQPAAPARHASASPTVGWPWRWTRTRNASTPTGSRARRVPARRAGPHAAAAHDRAVRGGRGQRQQDVEQRRARPGHGHDRRAGSPDACAPRASCTARARGPSASARCARRTRRAATPRRR